VRSADDLRIAPFLLLASEGTVHTDKDHLWQMATLGELCAADPLCSNRRRSARWT
jgi:protein phosphatase